MNGTNDFSDIDKILAEFSSYSSELINNEAEPAEEEAQAPDTVSQPRAATPARPAQSSPSRPSAVPESVTRRRPAASKAVPAPQGVTPYSGMQRPAPRQTPAAEEAAFDKTRRIQPSAPPRRSAGPEQNDNPGSESTRMIRSGRRPVQVQEAEFKEERPRPSRAPGRGRAAEKAPAKKKPAAPAMRKGPASLLGTVSAVISVLLLCWVFINVHPYSGTRNANVIDMRTNIIEKFDNFVNNTASDALGDLAYIPKIYSIDEALTVAPKPDPAKFGSTTDPNEIMAIIEKAGPLLDGQEFIFKPDANFVPGSPIQYYLDDTILAITWQEDINNKLCSCSEVKVAHGSQLRRKLADDAFNSGRQYYASDMAKQCNAIVAINGDFYANRSIGISAYNRELYRFTANDRLESCAFTASGDMLFIHAGELYDEEYTRQYMKDNDVVFLISFGPILIENGELKDLSSGYPIGEINHTFSRTGIAQMGPLHYFTMNINYGTSGNGKGYGTAATLSELGEYMYNKGCHHAYTLDGGQTSVLLMNGKLVNHVDYGNERLMSDIIYFATAVPEEEAAQ